MKTQWTKLSLLAAVAAAACGGNGSGQPGPTIGQLKSGSVQVRAVCSTPSPVLPKICGDFTLTPYSLDADGTPTRAGEPLHVSSTTVGGTLTITGCLDTPGTANDWEYLVNATNFAACPGEPALPAGSNITPASVSTVVAINCQAGLDVAAAITVEVSVPVANNAGYVDINATVNATPVMVGCKTPDDGNHDGIFNFGESWVGAAADAPHGVWGHTQSPANVFQQWSGQAGTADNTDQYYTGTVNTNTGVPYLLQTLVPRCASGQGYSGTSIPGCVTPISASTFTVNATLLEAFEQVGSAWAAAGVVGNQVRLTTSAAGYNYIPAGPTPTAYATPHNNVVTLSTLPAPSGTTFQSVYPYRGGPGLGFVVTFLDASSVASWNTVEYVAGVWKTTHSGTIGGTSATLLNCLGIYSTADACYAPGQSCFH